MKVVSSKLIYCLAIVYVTLLFSVVIPLHHHDDLGSHDDCAICAISNQPQISVGSSSIQILFILLLTLVLTGVAVITSDKISLYLRGPPVF